MLLSQVGEYIDDLSDLNPIITEIINSLLMTDSSDKIRYACYHCIGQYCEDIGVNFILQVEYRTLTL